MKRIRTSVSGIVVALLMLSQLPISSLNAWSLLDVGTSFAQASQVNVTKSAPTEAHPGETLLYSIVVRNNGATEVTGELNDPVTNFTAHLTLIPGESGSQTHPGTQCVTDPGGEVSCSPITISAGGVATYYLKFNVGLSAPCSGTFNNVASFTYDPGNITATSNTSATTYSCPPKVDLRVEKTGPSTIPQGGTIVYTVSAVHVSGPTATNVLVQDPAPNGVSFNPAQSDPSCQQQADIIICSTPSLAPGGRKDFAIAFNVPQQATCGSVITNTAALCTADQEDPVPGNDVFNGSINTTVTCAPQGADLSVTKSGPQSAQRGGTVSYSVTAINAGPGTATNVVIADVIPSGLTFNANLSSPECVLNGNGTSVLCNNFSLSSGQSRGFTIVFNVPTIQNCNDSTVQNQATLSSSSTDPNSGNNMSSVITTTLTCPPPVSAVLSLQKSGPQTVVRGNTLSYTLTVSNGNQAAAQNVVITDPVPFGLTFQSAGSDPLCTVQGNVVSCAIGTLNPNQSRTLTLNFQAPGVTPCSQTTVQNQATVTSNQSSVVQSQAVSTVVTCPVVNQPNITVTKSASTQARPGQTVQYSIIVRNNGSQPVTGELFDPVGNFTAHLTLVPGQSTSSTHPGVQCVTDPGGEVSCSPVTINPGDLAAFLLTFNVSQAAPCSGTFNNVAQFITDPSGIAISSNTSSTTFSCPPQVDLRIEKTGPSTVVQGGVIVYTVSAVHVSGPTATNVLVQDPAPNGVIFNAALSDPSCQQQADLIICSTPTLAPGARKDFALAFTVPQQTACGTVITNTAAICKADQQDPVPGNDVFNANVNTTVLCPQPQTADVSVQKSGPSSALAGGTVSYTVTATNAGPATATNVIVSDVVPAGLSFNAAQSSNSCTLNGNGTTVLCSNFNLNQGESRTFTLVFNLPQPGNSCQQSTVQNQATVSSSITDSNSSNNQSATIFTQIVCPQPQGADLLVFKNGPATALRGSTVGYSVSVVNAGPAAAQNVIVTDIIPAGLTFNASLSSQSCALNQSQTAVQCTIASLAANQSQAFAIVFDAPLIQNCTQQNIQNQATVTSSTADPASSNNASSIIVTRLDCPAPSPATLTIQKSGPSSVVRGSTFSYSLLVSNTSQTTAQNVSVLDPVPFGLTYQAFGSDPSCSVQANDVVCTIGTLGAGQTRTLTLNFQAPASDPCASAVVQNRAFVTSTQSNLAQSQIVSTTVTCPQPQGADVSVSKSGPATVLNGGNISYTLIASNAGPGVATNVVVADVIPSGVTFNAGLSSPECVLNGNGTSVLCNNFSLASGQTRTFIVTFTATALQTCVARTVLNQATVSSSSTDQNTSNNTSALVTTQVTCPQPQGADLSVQKTGPSTVIAGGNISYTITAANSGPGTAQGVVIHDVIPSGLTFNAGASSPECVQSGNEVQCRNFDLTSGQTRVFIVTFGTQIPQTCIQTAVQNVATITSNTTDPSSGNNVSSTVSIIITCTQAGQPDLTLEKTGPSTVTRGGTLTYILTVRNIGGQVANNVFVTDPVPSGLTYQPSGSTNTCSLQGGSVSCNVGTLAAGDARVLTLNFLVPDTGSCSQTTIQNVAAATTTSAEKTTANNQSTTVTTSILCPNVQFAIQKTDNRSTVQPGENITYTITVQNLSSTNASNVMVTDPMPSLFAFTSASDGGFLNGQTVTWNNLFIGANSSRTLTIQGQISPGASNGNVITNTATVNGVTATDTTVVQTGSSQGNNLTIDITDSPDPVRPDQILTYTIRLTNLNSNTITGLTMTQILPPDVEFVSASDGGYQASVVWNNLTLNGNATRTFTVTVRVDEDARDGDRLNTTVYASNASDTETTLVRDDETNDRVRVDVTASPDDVCVDETISYTIAVRNDESESATVDLRAYLDTRTVFESANDGGRNMGAGEVRWDNIRVSRYSTEFVTLRVRVRAASYNDSIRLRVDGGDNQEDIETTRVRTNCGTVPPPSQNVSLFVSKQADRSEAQPGDTVYYSVTVRNTSNVPAYNVSVEDTFPAHQMSIGDAGGGIVSGDRIRWTVGTLSANETRTFTYNGTLRSSLRQGDVVQNNVRVTADNIGAVPNAVASVRIIQILPATGAGFTGPLSTVGAMLRPFGSTSSPAAIPSILWLSIALMGLAAGGGLGKRFLL